MRKTPANLLFGSEAGKTPANLLFGGSEGGKSKEDHHGSSKKHHNKNASLDNLAIDLASEQELSLKDKLKLYRSSQFNSENYLTSKCQSMGEKEIRHVCTYLKDLKKGSAEEMRKSVYANYPAFIRTAKEISALEGQLLSLRNLMSAQAQVIHSLSDGAQLERLSASSQATSNEDSGPGKNKELRKLEAWLSEFLESMEVLLAEKRIEEALDALDQAQTRAKEANDQKTLSPKILLSVEKAISDQRQKLGDQLMDMAGQPSTRRSELRSAISALKRLGDAPKAHSLLLKVHHKRLRLNMQNLQPILSSTGGGNVGTGGAAYCTNISQIVFSTIALASKDSLAGFGEDTCFTSELVTWAVKETENLALLAKRHTLALAAGTGNLRVAAECVHVCLGHCTLLESRGFALSPVLLKHFKPLVNQALTNNLARIERICSALAADDDWSLPYTQPRLTSSAQKFFSMVNELVEDVETLEILQLTARTQEGVVKVFNSYIKTMINALPAGTMHTEGNHEGAEIVKHAENEMQQLALLANALLLADELIPRAGLRLIKGGGQREWKKRLQRSIDSLRDSFCRQHTLDLIFTYDGDLRLNADMYTTLDSHAHDIEWFPSGIFQELFAKMTQIASIAADMFAAKERFATMLLMRLTETVILWLSDDQAFWAEIEQGENPLGPLGLQQFYLDMNFVIFFASHGRYLSRNLQQVAKNIMARAIEAVSAQGIDPYSSLPDDEWFNEVALMAIKMLTGNTTFENVGAEALSPTASDSVYSQL